MKMMKTTLLTIGEELTRKEQQKVKGGTGSDWNCAPQYTQAQCDNYCWSMHHVYIYSEQNEDWHNGDLAMNALIQHCGIANPI